MQFPQDGDEAKEMIATGRLLYGMLNSQGYEKIFEPFLTALLEKADSKCHDYKLRADRGKEAVVEFNTIKVIMNFCAEHIENMQHGIEYCRENDIDF